MKTKSNGADPGSEAVYSLLREEKYESAFALANAQVLRGDESAVMYLGWMRERGAGCPRDENLAEKYYRQAAEAGSATAQFYLGRLLLRLSGDTEARNWFVKAAEQRYSPALYRLALLTRRDSKGRTEEADNYLQQAASLGHYFARRDVLRQLIKSSSGLRRLAGYWKFLSLIWSAVQAAYADEFDDRFLY